MNIFGLGTTELIIILVVILILFGPKRLPQLGKSIGKTMRAIRDGADGKAPEEDDDEVVAAKPKKAAASASAKKTSDNSDLDDEE
jgi:sec-independent protein translocase protein TatA